MEVKNGCEKWMLDSGVVHFLNRRSVTIPSCLVKSIYPSGNTGSAGTSSLQLRFTVEDS